MSFISNKGLYVSLVIACSKRLPCHVFWMISSANTIWGTWPYAVQHGLNMGLLLTLVPIVFAKAIGFSSYGTS